MGRKEEILTSAEARRYLKIGRTKLWQLTKEQLIPSYRLGSSPNASLRYKRSELLRWLEKNRLTASNGVNDSGGA
ncbi:MAG TPA: helix-turn-helix domain-containing protein [Candidatus Polarisedimenticolia bacterium]|jgi:excisionase family DNA binding protein|nr:helix-turn-helix domain-containing protein [Candidatus Polarisedimenticolia bacterium]